MKISVPPTVGEWRLNHFGLLLADQTIVESVAVAYIGGYTKEPRTSKEHEIYANAQVIRSAKDLLASAKLALVFLTNERSHPEVVKSLQLAIDRATYKGI